MSTADQASDASRQRPALVFNLGELPARVLVPRRQLEATFVAALRLMVEPGRVLAIALDHPGIEAAGRLLDRLAGAEQRLARLPVMQVDQRDLQGDKPVAVGLNRLVEAVAVDIVAARDEQLAADHPAVRRVPLL